MGFVGSRLVWLGIGGGLSNVYVGFFSWRDEGTDADDDARLPDFVLFIEIVYKRKFTTNGESSGRLLQGHVSLSHAGLFLRTQFQPRLCKHLLIVENDTVSHFLLCPFSLLVKSSLGEKNKQRTNGQKKREKSRPETFTDGTHALVTISIDCSWNHGQRTERSHCMYCCNSIENSSTFTPPNPSFSPKNVRRQYSEKNKELVSRKSRPSKSKEWNWWIFRFL